MFFWYTNTAHAAITRIQPASSGSTTQGVCSGFASGGALSCSFTTTPKAGNTILITCSANTTQTWSLPTDNQSGNHYNNIAAATGNGTSVSGGMWWANVSGSTGTFTVTCHGNTSTAMTVLLLEYSGINSSPVDQSNGASGSGVSMNPGIINTTNPNDLIIGFCTNSNGGSGTATFTPNTGFTIQNQVTNDTIDQTAASMDQVVSSTGGYTASMTYAPNNGDNTWWCGVGAFKANVISLVSIQNASVLIKDATVTLTGR